MIIKQGDKLYWSAPQDGIWKAKWEPTGRYGGMEFGYFLWDNGYHEITVHISFANIKQYVHSDFWNKIENPFSFRQRGPLSKEELEHLNKLNGHLRFDILGFNQGR